MEKKEMTVKQTRGTAGEYQVSFVNALKALDEDKAMKPIYERMEREYQQALRDIAETVLDMEFDESGNPKGNFDDENNSQTSKTDGIQ